MRTLLVALALTSLLAVVGNAQPPSVDEVVQRMKTVLEPPRSSTRKLTLVVHGDFGESRTWTAVQARKQVGGQQRVLTAITTPADDRGIAVLAMDGTKDKPDTVGVFLPVVRRTRIITPLSRYESFLNSDFTYSDLGLVSLQAKYTLLGAEKKNGAEAYKVQAVPAENWYYSKVVMWLDAKTLLPIERDYYDPSGTLWKVETFGNVTVIDGQPSALQVKMEDKQTKTSSDLTVSAIKFDVELPDTIFEPGALKGVLDVPAVKAVAQQP